MEAAKGREGGGLERRIAKEEERGKQRIEREAEAARKAEEARVAAEAAALEAERIRRGGRPISKMGSSSSKPPAWVGASRGPGFRLRRSHYAPGQRLLG